MVAKTLLLVAFLGLCATGAYGALYGRSSRLALALHCLHVSAASNSPAMLLPSPAGGATMTVTSGKVVDLTKISDNAKGKCCFAAKDVSSF